MLAFRQKMVTIRFALLQPENGSRPPWSRGCRGGGWRRVVANLSSGQTDEWKNSSLLLLARSQSLSQSAAQIICAFREWANGGGGDQRGRRSRRKEKRFQEDVNNDILSHHRARAPPRKALPRTRGGRYSVAPRNLDPMSLPRGMP